MFGGQHAAADRLVGALDLGYVEQAGGVADQQRPGHLDLRQRLPAARHDRARAGRADVSAFEPPRDVRVVLPLLESLPRLEFRAAVVQAAYVAHSVPGLVPVTTGTADE